MPLHVPDKTTIFREGEGLPLSASRCASLATPSSGDTPQLPENRSGAVDALCLEDPAGLLLRAPRLTLKGPRAL
jgi:hypothetical protein